MHPVGAGVKEIALMREHAISPGKGSVTAGTQTFVPVALARLGAIEITRVGYLQPSGGKASEFRYLLADADSGLQEDERGVEI